MSSLAHELESLRDALVGARRDRRSVSASNLPQPRSDADAYAVQDAVAEALGWFASGRPRAWKVGASSRGAMPNAAPLPSEGIHETPATFAFGTFQRMLIEGEIAFRLRSPIDANGGEADAARAVGEWLVTIEVVDPRYADMDTATPLQRLADQGLHGALVVGSGGGLPDAVDWRSLVARVLRDGDIVTESRGGHPLGNLLFLLPWLARHAAERGMPLAAGDIVTAGTWTGVFEARPGQTIEVEFPAIGRASARFMGPE